VAQIGSILVGFGKGLVRGIVATLHASRRQGGGTDGLNTLKFGAIPRHIDNNRRTFIAMHMTTAKMLSEVLLAREPITGAAVAIAVRAHKCLLGISVLLVDFTLVAQETARVGEALDFVAVGFIALVGAVMFIHVFTGVALVFGAARRVHERIVLTSIRKDDGM
jgi:hypothetical protein